MKKVFGTFWIKNLCNCKDKRYIFFQLDGNFSLSLSLGNINFFKITYFSSQRDLVTFFLLNCYLLALFTRSMYRAIWSKAQHTESQIVCHRRGFLRKEYPGHVVSELGLQRSTGSFKGNVSRSVDPDFVKRFCCANTNSRVEVLARHPCNQTTRGMYTFSNCNRRYWRILAVEV